MHEKAHLCPWWWGQRVVSVQHPLFQPCSHPNASKQQMAYQAAADDLVQPCLLGSNCVLTWRETEYYDHAGKQIIVTSLAARWLCLSHVQMEFEENKLARDAAWLRCTHVSVRERQSVCLVVCLSVFSPQPFPHPWQMPVFLLIRQPICCVYRSRCFITAVLYGRRRSTGTKNLFMWIKTSIYSP